MSDDLEWRDDEPPKRGPVLLLLKDVNKKFSAVVSEFECCRGSSARSAGRSVPFSLCSVAF
jgi:hypothetical protein